MTQIAEAFVRLRADASTFRAEATTGIQGALGGIGKTGLRGAAAFTGITAAATLVTIALKEVVVGAGEYEREMDVLRVVSGATEAEMAAVGETAKALGADLTLPGTSAADAAVSMNELAKAGLTIEDAMAGAKGALQLATAGEIGVKDASALAAAALNAFGLAGDQATHVADLLAGASIAAQGEVGDMGLALQQAGAVSRQAGLSIEQTVGAIALLAKNGILGSDAGTSLRTTLLKLIPTTKEAKQFTDALGISIDENRTLGEQLPEVIEQYRVALADLNETQQQQALTQIFGTDAIRAASIFAREGAVGYLAMVNAVDRAGAANEIATAKTEGLLGTFDGLKSQLSTLAVEFGLILTPALTDFLEVAAGGVGIVNSLVGALKDLGGVEIPGTDLGLGEIFSEAVVQLSPAGWFRRGQLVAGAIKDGFTSEPFEVPVPDMENVQAEAKSTAATLAAIGEETGADYIKKFGKGISDNTASALDQAKASLRQVIQAGKDAVAEAVASAQQNLSSLGGDLAAQAGQIIDASGFQDRIDQINRESARIASANQQARQREAIDLARKNLEQALADAPIQRRIEQLQAQLDAREQRASRRDVTRTLRDAQEELAEARGRVGSAGQLTSAQQQSTARFLRPFQEAVTDARDEVGRFNTEANIDKLQAKLDRQTDDVAENIGRLKKALQDAKAALVESQRQFATEGIVNSLRESAEAQKKAVTQGIQDSIQAFNDGLITLPELNKRLAKLLSDNGIDYRRAGTKLGTAFVRGFEATLKTINDQAVAILAGPQDPGAGLVGDVVRPKQTVAEAAANVAAARAAVEAAQLEAQEEMLDVLKQIRDARSAPDATKTRSGDSGSTTVERRSGR